MKSSTFVFAKIIPKAEFFEQAKDAIKDIIPQTRAEPGCKNFSLHIDGSGNLYLYEEWKNDHALALHHDMPYTKAIFEAYESWLATPPEINKLLKIA